MILSIFTIPKAFCGRIELIQRNAIKSRIAIGSDAEVILVGDDEGTLEIAQEFELKHIPAIDRNRFNTPTVSSAFDLAQGAAQGSVMAYVNADIMLTPDVLKVAQMVPFSEYLVTGRRWDLDVLEEFDFGEPDWDGSLRKRAAENGRPQEPAGMDCFIFPKGMFRDLPPFGVGRAGWDNWMVYRARSLKVPVIDATGFVTIIHQNHDYAHHPFGVTGALGGDELEWNLKLGGGWDHVFTLDDANWILDSKGMRKRPLTRKTLLRRFRTIPVFHPGLKWLFDILKSCKRLAKRIFFPPRDPN